MVLVRLESGETFTPCSADAWTDTLDAWRADLQRIDAHPTLVRCRVRMQRQQAQYGRVSWCLYRAAKRALKLRGLPCPMPEGHCMFDDPSAYGLVRS